MWPIPIVLRLQKNRNNVVVGEHVTLLNSNNEPVSLLTVTDVYEPNLDYEFEKIYGCADDTHDYIKYVKDLSKEGDGLVYIGGKVEKIGKGIVHYNFNEYRNTPEETKQFFKDNGWSTILGFQTRNPMHKCHYELTRSAMKEISDNTSTNTATTATTATTVKLFLNPVIGVTQHCDVPYEVRVRCYIKLLQHYPKNSVKLSLLPLSMRMAGPREALWHALIRQNYGCTHFVVGRDHAGPSSKKHDGTSFFGPYDAHKLLDENKNKLQIKVIKSIALSYVPKLGKYVQCNDIDNKNEQLNLSGTRLREMLRNGEDIPEWFTFPEIAEELQHYYPPSKKQGFCLYFVGLSGCGKTTLSKAIIEKLGELVNDRHITMLDGDVVRENLGQLGFSKNDRSLNVRRIGYMAQTIVKNRGICVCANIAPYHEDREHNRRKIDNYIEIYLSTPLSICEKRDVKGLYKKARTGEIANFTGISDPFEEPTDSDLVLCCDSIDLIDQHIETIIATLKDKGLI